MPRSEASRKKDRARVRRWKKKNHARALAINRKAWKNWSQKNPRKTQRMKPAETEPWYQAGMSVVGQDQLRRPRILWLDQHGELHAEKELTAEELIRRWKEQQ